MMVIDHIGIVVRSLEHGIRQWELMFGYRQRSPIVTNTRQQVRVVFLSRTDSMTVKLVEPLQAASPLFAFARNGGGLHHLCFRCDCLKVQIPALQRNGARLTVPPEPGEAFCNHDIAFFLADNNIRLELIDSEEKEGWLADPVPLE